MYTFVVDYTVRGQEYRDSVCARNLKVAKLFLGKKHGYKDGRMIKIKDFSCWQLVNIDKKI